MEKKAFLITYLCLCNFLHKRFLSRILKKKKTCFVEFDENFSKYLFLCMDRKVNVFVFQSILNLKEPSEINYLKALFKGIQNVFYSDFPLSPSK